MPINKEQTEKQYLKSRVLELCSGEREKTSKECLEATFRFWDMSPDDEDYYIKSLWENENHLLVFAGPFIAPLCSFIAYAMLFPDTRPSFERDYKSTDTWEPIWFGWTTDISVMMLPFMY